MPAPRFHTRSLYWAVVLFAMAGGASGALAVPECPLELTGYPAGLHAERFVVADFDHDGVPDVVAVQPNIPYGNGGAVFLRGSHANGYSLLPPVTIASGDLLEIVTADFNADGSPDLAINDHVARSLRVLLGHGDGTFAPAVLYDLQDDPVGIAVADVDRDGSLDILVANGGTSPQLLMGHRLNGKPDGTFTSRPGPWTPLQAISLCAADLDGDGIMDIAVEEKKDSTVAVFRGRGAFGKWNGDWDTPVRLPLDDSPTLVRALDVDGDGWLDLVCATYSGRSTTYLGGPGLSFHVDSLLETAHAKAPFGVADWTHDGRASFVIADPGENTLRLEMPDSPLPFARDGLAITQPTRGNTTSAAALDLDGDGMPDAIAVSRDSSMFSVLLSRCVPVTQAQAPGAGWSPGGVTLTTTSGAKSPPRVASDGWGGAYVTWSDAGSTPAHVIAQHVLSDGRRDPAWSDGGVVVLPRASAATSPQVVSSAGGAAWVFWDETRASGRGIFAAPVLRDGRVPYWWSQLGYAEQPVGRALAGAFGVRDDGRRGWVQAWVGGAGVDARQQRASGNRTFYSPAAENGTLIGSASAARTEPIAIADAGNGVFQCCRSVDPAIAGVRLVLQRVTSDGVRAAGWPAGDVVLASGAGERHLLDMTSDGRGGVWVVWSDARTGVLRALAQRVDSLGSVLGPAAGIAVCDRPGAQTDARLVAAPGGNAIVVLVNDSGDGGDIVAQALAGGGLATGALTAGRMLCGAGGAQSAPVAIADSLGGAFVAWQDHRGALDDVFAMRIDGGARPAAGWPANGAAVCAAACGRTAPQLASLGSGQAIVVWSDARSGVSAPYAARLSPFAPVTAVQAVTAPRLALASASENPARGAFALRFTLPTAGPASLDVMDIAGRRVRHDAWRALAAGAHEWRSNGLLPPGVYLARVTHGGESSAARVVVLQP